MVYIRDIDIKVELILIKNSKFLDENPDLLNDNYQELRNLLDEYPKVKQKEILDCAFKCFIPYNNNRFGEMISLMVDNFAKKKQFSGYSSNWLDDMKIYAIELILRYINNFDFYRISPRTKTYVSAFSYITQIIHNAFIFVINKKKSESKINSNIEYLSSIMNSVELNRMKGVCKSSIDDNVLTETVELIVDFNDFKQEDIKKFKHFMENNKKQSIIKIYYTSDHIPLNVYNKIKDIILGSENLHITKLKNLENLDDSENIKISNDSETQIKKIQSTKSVNKNASLFT